MPINLNGIDLVTMRLLVAAAEEGNLARVAAREGLAISAISRRISDFERRFGLAVFDRHDRGLTPTPDGRQLLDRLAAIVEQVRQVAADIAELRDGTSGLVRLQAHPSASMSGELPRRLAAFIAAHPGIEVELDEATSLEIVHAVRVGTCEVGLVSGNVAGDGLELTPWIEDELRAILPVDCGLATRDAVSLRDLAEHPFIGMQRDSALLSLYRTQAAASNLILRERAHMLSFEGVRSMVAAGLGVAILPAIAAEPWADPLRLAVRPLKETWAHRPMALCTRGSARLTAAARTLVRHLLEPSG